MLKIKKLKNIAKKTNRNMIKITLVSIKKFSIMISYLVAIISASYYFKNKVPSSTPR